MEKQNSQLEHRHQWSKQEACFACATQVWLAVIHNTSVTSDKKGSMFEAYCMGK